MHYLPSRPPSNLIWDHTISEQSEKQISIKNAEMTQIFYKPQNGLWPDWNIKSLFEVD